MSKKVHLELSEKEYRHLLLCFMLGDFIKSNVEGDVSEAEAGTYLAVHMKLFKSAYDAGLKGAGKLEDTYYYGKDIEEKMLDLFEEFKDFVESGELAAQDELLRKHLEELEREERKQSKKK